MSNIQDPLYKLFQKHRIVFWYDTDKELRDDFENLDLPDVTKIELVNNEFCIKHHILREEPKSKFLIYHEGPQPDDIDNWLLDVQLAHGEFRTDQASIYLSELSLGPEFSDLIREHIEFFHAAKRMEALKKIVKPTDTPSAIRIKMLAICCGSDPMVDTILESLLGELAADRQDKINLITKCGLNTFLWEQLNRYYGYDSETKGIRDFVIALFQSCYGAELGGNSTLTSDAMVFLRRWKDSIRHRKAFEYLSDDCVEILSIEQDLQKRDYKTLQDIDYFRVIDQKMIFDLVRAVANRTVSAGECTMIVRRRRQSHWYEDFKHIYEAIEYAARFLATLDEMDLQASSLAEGIERYASSWYKLDQLYRKFIYHSRSSGKTSLLEPLTNQVEDLYTNSYLLQVNDQWQQVVDKCEQWKAYPFTLQKGFYEKWVKPFPQKNKKIFVIISDALRFEIGDELLGLIRREDRYDAEIDPMLAMLPSYTQLGMASLLPNKEISFAEDSATVFVDGVSSQGTANRAKILSNSISGSATAIRAEEFLGMNRDECRGLFRDHDVVYVFHNRIDATGDKKDSEDRVFEAAEETMQELIKIIKKLTAANATNMLVTSDHGFIYQNRPIEESDFADVSIGGDTIHHQDRRFVLGKNLTQHASLRHFTAKALGIAGDMEIQIPKSINRLRLKGSGSRYVHGGASLQELVLPVVKINKKRQSDVSSVGVDILRSGTSIITSGQLSVAFYQSEPVTGKKQPRILRAGIYTKDGDLISDSHELTFDFTSENPREREIQIRFLMTRKADEANGQDVSLRLEEQLPGTSHFREYKTAIYTIRRSFTSDFDF
jgi:uncharacterized protein (TIGR02687 family)